MSDLPDSSNPVGYGQRCETCTVVRHADIGNQSINLNMQGALTTFGTSDTVGPSRGHPRLACMLGLILPQVPILRRQWEVSKNTRESGERYLFRLALHYGEHCYILGHCHLSPEVKL